MGEPVCAGCPNSPEVGPPTGSKLGGLAPAPGAEGAGNRVWSGETKTKTTVAAGAAFSVSGKAGYPRMESCAKRTTEGTGRPRL